MTILLAWLLELLGEKDVRAACDHLQREVEKKFQMKTLFQITANGLSFPALAWPLQEKRVML